MLGHSGIEDNVKAYELARQGAATKYNGPEPALGIPRCSVREVIKKWSKTQNLQTWYKTPGSKHEKQFIIIRPCRKELKYYSIVTDFS